MPATWLSLADIPSEYGPTETLYNRYKRWSETGVFERIFNALVQEDADFQTLMLNATHALPGSGLPFANHERRKTHRIAANGVKKTLATSGQSG